MGSKRRLLRKLVVPCGEVLVENMKDENT